MGRKHFFTLLLSVEVIALLFVMILGIRNRDEGTMAEFTSDMLSVARGDDENLEVLEGTGKLESTFTGTNRRIISPKVTLNRGIYQVDVFYHTTTPPHKLSRRACTCYKL